MKLLKAFKNLILCVSASAAVMLQPATAYAEPGIPSLELELDVPEINRLCYAGHRGNTVNYIDGLAVTPDTSFVIEDKSKGVINPSDIKIEISVIYENDYGSSIRELVRRFDYGSVGIDEYYPIFSENVKENLESRGRLLSDSLMSLEVRVSLKSNAAYTMKKFFQVCTEDDLVAYAENADGAYVDEAYAEDPYAQDTYAEEPAVAVSPEESGAR